MDDIEMIGKDGTPIDPGLDDALWQVEVAKRFDIAISRAMNFINLSKDAKGYGNDALAEGMMNRAKETLFNDLIEHLSSHDQEEKNIADKMRMKRNFNEAKFLFSRGDIRGGYDLLLAIGEAEEEPTAGPGKARRKAKTSAAHSKSLDQLQKVYLRLKNEEKKGKDVVMARDYVTKARKALQKKDYEQVQLLCESANNVLQSPMDQMCDQAGEIIDGISQTRDELFDAEAAIPKERIYRKQIEKFLERAKDKLRADRPIEALDLAGKSQIILKALERDTIKGNLPNMILELKASLEGLRSRGLDLSYEDYLMKQMEESSFNEDYIEAKKAGLKLRTCLVNADSQNQLHTISTKLGDLSNRLRGHIGKDGYIEAKEALDSAKMYLEQSAFDKVNKELATASGILG